MARLHPQGILRDMTEAEFQLLKSAGFVSAFVFAVVIQRWRPHRVLAGSWRANALVWAIDVLAVGIASGGLASAVSDWARGHDWGLLNQGGVPIWLAVAISVLGLDLTSYFWHRANHRVRLLWRFHQAHHSDPEFTVTTALRFHPGELLLAIPVRLAAVALLGTPIVGIVVFEMVFAFANFFEHGNIDLPLAFERRLGRVMITPALHRRHHSREQQQLDSNYGTIFSFWDRLFGSFGDNRSDVEVDIGLPGIDRDLGALGILALPFRGAFRGR